MGETEVEDRARALEFAVAVVAHVRDLFSAWAGPQTGSELHADDEAWPWQPTSEVARASLLGGIDHLLGAQTLLGAGLGSPPVAFNSLLRGALLGSCQALWVLWPDDPVVRQARALWLSEQEYRARRTFHRTQAESVDPGRVEHAKKWAAQWDGRYQALGKLRKEFPGVDDNTSTKQIKWVAEECFSPDEDGIAQLVGAWQSLSSTAHSYSWGHFVRPGATPARGHEGRGPLVAFLFAPDADGAVDTFVLCSRLIGQAGRRLEERSTFPPATPPEPQRP